MSANIRIIQAQQEHLVDLAPLFQAYRVFYRKSPATAQELTFLKERLEQGDSTIFLALSGTQAVGFTQLYPLFSSTQMKRLWLLNDLYVAADFRGQQISKQLIDRAKQLARDTNAAGLSLETEKNNLIGNQLYPATGFVADEAHHFYFWETD